jgi:hypothetical protein
VFLFLVRLEPGIKEAVKMVGHRLMKRYTLVGSDIHASLSRHKNDIGIAKTWLESIRRLSREFPTGISRKYAELKNHAINAIYTVTYLKHLAR